MKRMHLGIVILIVFCLHSPEVGAQDEILVLDFPESLWTVTFDNTGDRLIVGGIGGAIWDFDGDGELISLDTQGARISDVVVDPSGSFIASAGSGGRVQLWDIASGEVLVTLYADFIWSAMSVAWHPTEPILASAHADGYVRLWDLESMTLIMEIELEDVVNSVDFSPDGSILVTGTGIVPYNAEVPVNAIQLWEVASGTKILDIRDVGGAILSVAFSSDGTMIAAGSSDETITIWDANSGDRIATIFGHEGSVTSVSFNLENTLLLSASNDSTVRLWAVDSWNEIAVYTEHSSIVLDADFSPDGSLIASVSIDKTAIIRQLALCR